MSRSARSREGGVSSNLGIDQNDSRKIGAVHRREDLESFLE